MNKYQEALLNIRYYYAQSQKYKKLQKYNAIRQLETLQELVDRDTPKKPNEQLIDNYFKGIPGETPNEKELNYFCPNCNELVGDEWSKYNYCPCCGQAIDWSE
jgi:hypothetical protein